MHTRVVVYVAGALLAALLVGVVTWRVLGARSTYEQALDTLPRSTLRSTYVDWQVVRKQARGTSLTAGSPASKVAAFLNRAYDLDLTSGSAISSSTRVLSRRYGFSPLDARWEAFGQSRQGQVDVLRLDDGVDLTAVERKLRRLGYTPPKAGAGKGGTWAGTPELVAGLSVDLTPVQQNLVVLPESRLVLMSDSAAYASEAAEAITGSGDSLLGRAGVRAMAGVAKDPAAAVQWSSTFACEDLTMGSADSDDQAIGKRLVAQAGKISPLEGMVVAQQADRSFVVGMHFETEQQASANLQPRTDLASGDAPGQGGTFRDRFTVTSGRADGHDVILDLRPHKDQVLSDITTGPILFATC